MKSFKSKILLVVLLIVAMLVVGCDTIGLNSGDIDLANIDLTKLKEQYGEFSITTTKGEEGVLSDDGATYTISVSSSKNAYTISGYFEGHIVINNSDDLSTFKGVKIILSNACLVTDTGSNIEYQVDGKNIEIVAQKSTVNYIINTGEGYYDCAVNSQNNIEVDGKGTLNIVTQTGHGLNAEGKIRFYDSPIINISSGHDAIHAGKFVSNNEEDAVEDYEAFTGTLNVVYALSQAFDCTTSSSKGSIDLSSGNYNIRNCESAFKTDLWLTIGGKVIVKDLTDAPVVRGAASIGVTIEILNGGSFVVDEAPYTNTVI